MAPEIDLPLFHVVPLQYKTEILQENGLGYGSFPKGHPAPGCPPSGPSIASKYDQEQVCERSVPGFFLRKIIASVLLACDYRSRSRIAGLSAASTSGASSMRASSFSSIFSRMFSSFSRASFSASSASLEKGVSSSALAFSS